MPSEPVLFAGIYARGAAAAQLTDEAVLQAMLDVEAALATACADEALIPVQAAGVIAAACTAERFDAEALGREAARHASPVVGLVAALRASVGEPYGEYVHLGGTSQDVLDTAIMLLASRALAPLLADADAAADGAAALADTHRATPMVGRTLLQQALPITFGLRAAGWMHGLDSAAGRLREIRDRELPVQMGGPVGARPQAIAVRVASELGLAVAPLPWQAIRIPVANLAGGLGTLSGVVAKIARDVTLFSQQEVGEAVEGGEPGGGRSSAMAHKRNPVAAVSALACAKRAPALVATALASMEQEHERAAGAWQAEWGVQLELLGLVGSATAWCRELLEKLVVDPDRMLENLHRLAASGAVDGRLTSDRLAACAELIDGALSARRR